MFFQGVLLFQTSVPFSQDALKKTGRPEISGHNRVNKLAELSTSSSHFLTLDGKYSGIEAFYNQLACLLPILTCFNQANCEIDGDFEDDGQTVVGGMHV